MRHSDMSVLEAAVREANPVPTPHELVDSPESAVLATLMKHRRQTLAAAVPAPRPPRWWLKPAVAFATACLLALSVIGVVALLANSPEPDEPVATSTTAMAPIGEAEIREVAGAPDGSLWVTTDRGIVRWDITNGTSTVYATEDGFPANDAMRIVVGSDGTVWAGSHGWISRFDGSWTTYSAPGSEGPMAVGPDGAVWTAFGQRDLARFDGSAWQTFEVPIAPEEGAALPWAASLDVAPDGTVWVGTHAYQGIFEFDGNEWTYHTDDSFPANRDHTVDVAPDGSIWVSSDGGVSHFDGSTWTHFTTQDGLLSTSSNVVVGSDGAVWAIHRTGVSLFDGDAWTAHPDVSGNGWLASVDDAGTLWMGTPSGLIGFDGTDVTRLEVPDSEGSITTQATTTTASPPTTTLVPEPFTWDPILATTRADTTPAAATCPPNSDPNTGGPIGQERPKSGWVGNSAAVFDQHAGRIVYIDNLGDTWAFDVCTSTWANLQPTGAAVGDREGGLVYDVDSNKVISLGRSISVYDPDTNTWTHQPQAWSWPAWSGVYDPVSGLVLVDHEGFLKAYNVDTDQLTTVGPIPEDALGLLGYSPELDRIITAISRQPALIDPRTGAISTLDEPMPSIVGAMGSLAYADGGDSAYVNAQDRSVCRFDEVALGWACFERPDHVDSPYNVFAAMARDTVNNRIVLINSVFGDWGVNSEDDVWAIDLDTGDWIQLVAPTDN